MTMSAKNVARLVRHNPGCNDAVRVVAVRAGHARGVHLALQERAVLVDLVLLLAVGLVEPLFKQGHAVGVGQRLAELVVEPALSATRVAARTRFHLGV